MSNDFKSFMSDFNAFLGDACESDIYDLRFDIAPSDNWFDGVCDLRRAVADMNEASNIGRTLRAYVAIDEAVNGIDVATIDEHPFLIDTKVDAEEMAYKAIWQAFELALAEQLVNAIVEARGQAYQVARRYLEEEGYKG